MASAGSFSSLISSNPLLVLCVIFLAIVSLINAKYKHRRRGYWVYFSSLLALTIVETLLLLNGRKNLAAFSLLVIVVLRRMCVPAITGGVGSGKSTLAKTLSDHGFIVIDCDAINRELLLPGSPAYASVIGKFGPSIVLDNGEIDRGQLREIVFNDEAKRLQLNKCLHTYIGLRVICDIFKYRILQWNQRVVLDIPLLYKTPLVILTGPIIVVTAPTEDRFRRLENRQPKIPRATILNIMKVQTMDEVLRSWGDIIVENTGTLESFMEQAEELAAKL